MNYYNENDKFAAAWLKELIYAGHLPAGDVDTRSIRDVRPDDLKDYTQCHFFSGIGGWSLALKLAGWPSSRPVWTGSCPCQPYSVAGKRKGNADIRNLWPVWFRLISECQPAIVFGEQVASKDGLRWLDGVSADMEGSGYSIGSADLCAAGVNAPHKRQRLYFGAVRLGQPDDTRLEGYGGLGKVAVSKGLERAQRHGAETGMDLRLADCNSNGCETWHKLRPYEAEQNSEHGCGAMHIDKNGSPWKSPEWLLGRDEKWRPVMPGTFPLAHGVSAGVGRLRGYGNAIVPQLAAEFITAFEEVTE